MSLPIKYFLIDWLLECKNLLHRKGRERRSKIRSQIDVLKKQVPTPYQRRLNTTGKKTVLFFPLNFIEFATVENVILESFAQAGFDPILAIPPGRSQKEVWRVLGWDRFCPYLTDYLLEMRFNNKVDVNFILKSIKDSEELITLSRDGVNLGKYTVSTLMRQTRKGAIDIADEKIVGQLKDALKNSIIAVKVAKQNVEQLKPNAVVIIDRGYTPWGQLFDVCLDRGVPVYTFNTAHRNNRILLKCYTRDNRSDHPSSLSKTSWKEIMKMSWDEDMDSRVMNELFDSYQSGEWYGEVGTQSNKFILDAEKLRHALSLNPKLKTAVIFPHIFWDATFFWGEDLFANYEEWFIETVKAAIGNDRLNWIIKIHPANLIKDQRDGYAGEHSEFKAIRENFGELPPHIRLLEADTKISTISLYTIADYCLTVRGTPGIEAACFGVTVLTAGTGRYDRLGFTADSDSREEYLNKVHNIDRLLPMTKGQIELARKFAYGVFLCRPVPLTSVKMEYQQDKAATLLTKILWKSRVDLKNSPEVQSLKKWIESGIVDYLSYKYKIKEYN